MQPSQHQSLKPPPFSHSSNKHDGQPTALSVFTKLWSQHKIPPTEIGGMKITEKQQQNHNKTERERKKSSEIQKAFSFNPIAHFSSSPSSLMRRDDDDDRLKRSKVGKVVKNWAVAVAVHVKMQQTKNASRRAATEQKKRQSSIQFNWICWPKWEMGKNEPADD